MRLKGFGIGRICIASCFPLCAVLLLGHQSWAAAHRLFSNTTYWTNSPDIAEKITLVNGEGVIWNGRLHASLYYGGRYVYGDFNQDGLRDAAVIIGESQGGSDDEVELAFLIYDGAEFVHRQSIYLGDSAVINSMSEQSGKVLVDMLIHQEGDCQAGPTKHIRNAYDYLKPNPDLIPSAHAWTPPQ